MAERRPLPAYDGDEPYIFVTYAHEDADFVYPHLRWLQDQGFNLWWDEGISPGAAWRAELANAIQRCSLLLYFITPQSVVSDHCTREVNFALDEHRRPVLAVHLVETSLPGALGLSLSDRQAILQHALEPEDYERKLISAVATYLEQPVPTATTPMMSPSRSRARTVLAIAALGSLIVGAVAGHLWTRESAQSHAGPEPQFRFEINLPKGVRLPADNENHFGIALNGGEIYFIGEQANGFRQVYVRRINQLETVALSSTAWTPPIERTLGLQAITSGAPAAVFPSPDGSELLVFYGDGALKTVDFQGSSLVQIAKSEAATPFGRRAHWGPHKAIAFRLGDRAIARFINGTIETVASDELTLSFPHLTPDGRGMLFVRVAGGTNGEILFTSFETGETNPIVDGSDPRITSTGHLLFVKDHAVWAVKMSAAYDSFTANPVRVLADLKTLGAGLKGHYAVSQDGTLVYETQREDDLHQLVWVSTSGVEEVVPIKLPPRATQASLSPDEQTIAFTTGRGNELWSYSVSNRLLTRRVASLPEGDWTIAPLFTPDGQRVLFTHGSRLFITDLRRAGSLTELDNWHTEEIVKPPHSWLADGETFFYETCRTGSVDCDIALFDLADPEQSRMILDSDSNERHAVLSPNGRYLAYESDEFGPQRIVIRPFPAVDSIYWQVPVDDCRAAKWSAAGDELFAWCGSAMIAIPIDAADTVEIGNPRILFSTESYLPSPNQVFHVSADGQRFLMWKVVPQAASKLVVVTNWLDEMQRLVEAGNREKL